MCDQQRLRPACAYAQSGQSLCKSLEYCMTFRLQAEHHLVFLGLPGGCIGSCESTLVKMPHWWKSQVTAHFRNSTPKKSSLVLPYFKRSEKLNEPWHWFSNNVAFWHEQTQMSLWSLLSSLETPNDVGQKFNTRRIFKWLAKALISLRICADWSEPLLVAHTTLLEIPFQGSNVF